jgi:hypothetical protein
MCSTKPLDYAITKLKNKNLCIEVGGYYAGWTKYLASKFNSVIAFQTPDAAKLNHIGTTDGEFSEDGLKWKELMRSRVPDKYHGKYSFDFLAEQIQNLDNVMQILHNSPPTVEFNYAFDLCTIDITRDPVELCKQYNYWKNKGNKNSVILMGIYKPMPYDNFAITQDEFLEQIETNWYFYDQDPRYIIIEL